MALPCLPKEAEAIAQEAIAVFHPMIENYKTMFETALIFKLQSSIQRVRTPEKTPHSGVPENLLAFS